MESSKTSADIRVIQNSIPLDVSREDFKNIILKLYQDPDNEIVYVSGSSVTGYASKVKQFREFGSRSDYDIGVVNKVKYKYVKLESFGELKGRTVNVGYFKSFLSAISYQTPLLFYFCGNKCLDVFYVSIKGRKKMSTFVKENDLVKESNLISREFLKTLVKKNLILVFFQGDESIFWMDQGIKGQLATVGKASEEVSLNFKTFYEFFSYCSKNSQAAFKVIFKQHSQDYDFLQCKLKIPKHLSC